MKRILQTILILMTSQGYTQSTVTSTQFYPGIGEECTLNLASGQFINPGLSGPNQIWDFSNAQISTPLAQSFHNDSEGSGNTYYPYSNILCLQTGISTENYYKFDTDKWLIEGHYTPNSNKIVYTDLQEMMHFPVIYQNQYNTTFSGTISYPNQNITLDRQGDRTEIVDGFGTLKLPGITINDVIKITVSSLYYDYYLGFEYYEYVDTTYMWIHPETKYILASYSIIFANNTQMGEYSYFRSLDEINTSIENISKTELNIYPCPIQNTLNFSGLKGSVGVVNIYDISGKLIFHRKEHILSNPIDVSELDYGIFIVEVLTEDVKLRKKILKD